MDDHQRNTLASHLMSTRGTPPQHRLEELQQGFKVNLGLYEQEKDSEGAAIYRPLVALANKAKSVAELEELLKSQMMEALWKAMPNLQAFSRFLSGLLGPAVQEGMGRTQYAMELSEAIRLAPNAKDAQDLLRMVEEAMRSIDEASPGP